MSLNDDENFHDCNKLTVSEIDRYIASDSESEDCYSSGDSWKPPSDNGNESDPAFDYDDRETDCNSPQLSTNHSIVSLSDNIDSSTSTSTQLLISGTWFPPTTTNVSNRTFTITLVLLIHNPRQLLHRNIINHSK
ncbi:hypothetical protein J6590_083851 [Homalodisca vitripennis]|nr:hypothetical protein J6590_083851 [Homalodisca vitripennis]